MNHKFCASMLFASLACFATAVHGAPITLTGATATFSQGPSVATNGQLLSFEVTKAIDGSLAPDNGWGIYPQVGRDQAAVFQVAGSPIGTPLGTDLTFTLSQLYSISPGHSIGKFKISVTTDPNPTAASNASWHNLQAVTFAANPA